MYNNRGETSAPFKRPSTPLSKPQKKSKFHSPTQETPLEDTLDNVNLSALIDESPRKEFDAFAHFFSNHAQNSSEEDLFSQSFNTQMINQIDTVISCDDSSDNDRKLPLLKSLSDKIANFKPVTDKSLLFSDDTVTCQYRKEVDDLFEEIGKSILCSNESSLGDDVIDVLFTDEPQIITDDTIQRTFNKTEDSLQIDCSFGSLIKQALLNNAGKSVEKAGVFDASLNRTMPEHCQKMQKLGDFYDLPHHVKELFDKFRGIKELYDWQDECLKLAISNRRNLIYALPTSGGKTLVAEILMLREVLCYQRNALFILPYVAIVQEKVWDFSPFGVALDFLVEEYASSKGTYPPRKRRRKHSVYMATIEKALGLVNSLIETGRLKEIGLIVIDELHLIGEEGRGATLEACLAKIMFMNENIQIVGMSATIGNINDISKFLKAEVYSKDFRPVELIEYVKCEDQIAKINWNSQDEDDLLVDSQTLDFKYSEAVSKLDPDMIGGLVLQIVPKGSCLVFCPSKVNCENVVNLLCKLSRPYLKNHLKDEKEKLLKALEGETEQICPTLKVSVPFGIAYHHSGLTSEERRLLEEAFRVGTICVICCTSTLAAGVNLPAKRVVLRSPYIGREFINLSRYKQMAGRAGRTGLGETGESIIVTSKADLPKVKNLLISPMNQAFSSLHLDNSRGLRHLLLSCISLGIANTRAQLQLVAQSSLMAVQVDKLNINIKKLTDTVIKSLFKMGALQEGSQKGSEKSMESQCNVSVRIESSLASLPDLDSSIQSSFGGRRTKKTLMLTSDTKLVVSSMGVAAIKGGLDLARAHQLYDDLHQAQKSLVLLNCLHLLYLVTPYETAEQIRPNINVYYHVLTHLSEKEIQTARILGFDEGVTVRMATGKRAKNVPEAIQNRFYVTLMLNDLWNELPIYKVAEKYQINRGIVQNLMLSSATFATNVVHFCEEIDEFWAFSHLLKGLSQRLSHCCIRELAPLMELPSVKQSRAKQLYVAGYKNLQAIAKAKVDDLMGNIDHLSRRTASQLIAAAKMLLLEKVENLREEAEDVLDGVEDPRKLLNSSLVPFK